MAYFSNGIEGEFYAEKWCDKCVHSEILCPVWAIHLQYNYESNNDIKNILDLLIPRVSVENGKCNMFFEKKM